jgi:hypothetical protein
VTRRPIASERRAELMAALRASVGLGGGKAAPLAGNRRRRQPRPREQAPATPPEPLASSLPELPPVNNAVLWHVEKGALPLSEPRRYRDRAHLEFVASRPCLLCGRQPCDAHHLRFMQPWALGRRVSDEFAVPLCRTHHRTLHRSGDEALHRPRSRSPNGCGSEAGSREFPSSSTPSLARGSSVHGVDDSGANPSPWPGDQ